MDGSGPRPRPAELGLPDRIACPFCGSTETELHSLFGTALSVATYWCRACRSPFEWFKWDGGTGTAAS